VCPEHPISRFVRRAVAILSLLSIAIMAIALTGIFSVFDVVPPMVFLIAFWTAFAMPWATFIIHFNLFSPLTPEAKKLWRNELTAWDWNSWRPTFAVWAYLVSSDREARARQFGPYRGGPES
jgi:hypothetical protein